MLTVLIKYRKSGIQTIQSAERVEFHPAHGLLIVKPGDEPHQDTGNFPEPYLAFTQNADSPDVDYRDVYVMNDKGKTVGTYQL